MGIAGYIVGQTGERGSAYTYVLAGNGLFLEAENTLMAARILVAPAEVRGLAKIYPGLSLHHGLIPPHLLSLALVAVSACLDRERYAAITWDGEYRLVIPFQDAGAGHVTYSTVPSTVVSIHSHPGEAFFSSTDNHDEQGFLISVVLGELDRLIVEAGTRLCVYGYFTPLRMREVFAGMPAGLMEKENT